MFIPVPVVALPLIGGSHADDTDMNSLDVAGPQLLPEDITVHIAPPPTPVLVNAADHSGPQYVPSWDAYVGQDAVKRQLRVFIDDAEMRMATLPHILLASGMPGVGKTTLARLIAQAVGSNMIMLVPPFHPATLYQAAMAMDDGDILFIDEIHKLGDHGPAAAENLLHMLEEKTIYLDDGVHQLADFCVIGATTDADKLPEAIIDRFTIKPYFQKYTIEELARITLNFCRFFNVTLLNETVQTIALACRAAPRVARDFVESARSLQNSTGYYAEPDDLLHFMEVEPDGLTQLHKAYILALFQFFGREHPEHGWEYVAGEMSLVNILRQNKPGVARLERFLIELGLVDRTPSGRRLTPRGIGRARELVSVGQELSTQ